MPLGNSHPPRCDLAARPCVALPYSGSAIHSPSNQHKRHTHCLCDTHSVHFFTDPHTHTHTVGKLLLRPAPPHTHTNCRKCFVHSLTGQLLKRERGREREAGGRREMETARDRGITKRSRPRQIDKKKR